MLKLMLRNEQTNVEVIIIHCAVSIFEILLTSTLVCLSEDAQGRPPDGAVDQTIEQEDW